MAHFARNNGHMPGTQFYVRLAKISAKTTHIPKHMHVEIAEKYTKDIVHFLQEEPTPQ